MVGLACGVGAYAAERARDSMRAYYGFRGPASKTMEVSLPGTAEEIRDALKAFEEIGTDEVILEPGIGDLDQLDRLAEVAQ